MKKIAALNALRHEHLEQIANKMPQFTMKYNLNDIVSVRDIVIFLRNAKQLRRATFLFLGINERNEIANHLINEWEISVNIWNACTFIRNEYI